MTEEVREQMLNVMFGASSESQLEESEEVLDEGKFLNKMANIGNKIQQGYNKVANTVNAINSLVMPIGAQAKAKNAAAFANAKQATKDQNAILQTKINARNAANAAEGDSAKILKSFNNDAQARYNKIMNDVATNPAFLDKSCENCTTKIDNLVIGLAAALAGLSIYGEDGDNAEDLKSMKKAAKQDNKNNIKNAKNADRQAAENIKNQGMEKANQQQRELTKDNAQLSSAQESVRLASLIWGDLPSLKEEKLQENKIGGFAKQMSINIISAFLAYNKNKDASTAKILRDTLAKAANNLIGGNTNYLSILNNAKNPNSGKALFTKIESLNKALQDVLKSDNSQILNNLVPVEAASQTEDGQAGNQNGQQNNQQQNANNGSSQVQNGQQQNTNNTTSAKDGNAVAQILGVDPKTALGQLTADQISQLKSNL